MSQSCMIIIELNIILGIPARQYHSEIAINFPSEEIAAPALGFTPLVFQGKQGTMPATPPRGFLNDITSHFLTQIVTKWTKFENYSKPYNFGTTPNF
jgi:hypothetical protein